MTTLLKKYWFYIQRSFMKKLEYRGELLLWLALDSIPIFTLLIWWRNVFPAGTNIQGYTLATITTYTVITMWVMAATGAHFEHWRITQIREGKIDLYLTKPISYLMDILLSELGNKLLYFFCLTLPVYGVITFFISRWQPVELPVLTFYNLLSFMALMIFGYLLEIAFGLTIVITSFWLEGADGLEHFKWISISLLSGQVMPLAFLPKWLQNVSAALPFKYAYAVPIGVLQGTHTLALSDWLWMIAWVAMGAFGLSQLWKAGLRAYSSAGG
jgi:ABC-2 type transport system permease protein